MDKALSALDTPSRQTVESLLEIICKIDAKGVGELFEINGLFSGTLTAGSFRGRNIIESHIKQIFKRFPNCTGAVNQITVSDRQVDIEWCITNPDDDSSAPIPARCVFLLGPSGLIESLRAEWNPRLLPSNQ